MYMQKGGGRWDMQVGDGTLRVGVDTEGGGGC